MREKPLHVRVAGPVTGNPTCSCTGNIFLKDGIPHIREFNTTTGECLACGYRAALRYDTDWSATGPLIEKYGIALLGPDTEGHREDGMWEAIAENEKIREGHYEDGLHTLGETPLRAVCHLILALSAAGKLKP